MGAFSNHSDCRLVKTQNTRMVELLRQVSDERNATSLPAVAFATCEMDTQQISPLPETTLGQCLQVSATTVKEVSDFV